MKYKYNGQWEDLSIKALDSMPVGTTVEYTGQASDIPSGWEVVSGQNKITKVSNTTPTMASIVDGYSTSTQDGYSCNYVNGIAGYVLYNNANGTNGNVTLSDSVTNYEYVELYYYYNHWAGKIYGSTKIDNPNAKILSIGSELQYQDNGNMYYSWARITFNSSTLELVRAGTGTTVDDGSSNADNQIYIYKVVGYN